jgi:hypothetical protein
MNIKLKAFLITLATLVGIFGFCYTLVMYPIVILFVVLAGLFYAMYRLVLNFLEYNKDYYERHNR